MPFPLVKSFLISYAAGIFGARATRRSDDSDRPSREETDLAEENRRLAAELASLQREHHALLEWCGVGVLVMASDGVIQRANITSARLFRTTVSQLTGKSLLQATVSEEMDQLFRSVRDGRAVRHREVRDSLPGGSALVISICSVLEGPDAPPRFVLIAHDVSELRRLETIRRDFVANVSHELRTPLASIRAMAETLQDGALQDPAVAGRFLGTIVTETERLARIAEDLLILSDAESRQPERERVALTPLLEQVINRVRAQAEKSGISLSAYLAPDLVADANHDQMEQVIVNLVDNAIKYTPAGGSVHIIADREGEDVAIHVRDTGIGILSADLPRIFERFYRVDKARSRQSGGTGLGLSIVKHITEAHGGSVIVDSEYNHGSTFTVRLPVIHLDGGLPSP